MSYKISLHEDTNRINVEKLANLVSKGFERPNDTSNLNDTRCHLEMADCLQIAEHDGEAVGFAAYRRLLWRSSYRTCRNSCPS